MGLSDLFINPEDVVKDGVAILHLLFLLVAYGYILSKASGLISDGSELLLLIPSLAGIVGSVVLPVLGAVPDGAIVLFSGMGTPEEVKEQIAVGVGALAGSTIMLLTIPWALCIIMGRVDLNGGVAQYTKKPKLNPLTANNLNRTGVTPRSSIAANGKIMIITAVSYLIIQIAAFAAGCGTDAGCKPSFEHWPALVATLTSLFCFIGYLVYNVKFADEEDKEDLVTEVKKKAIESHILSISQAFETSFAAGTDVDGERRFNDALAAFFKKYDRNDDKVIDAFELRSLLNDLNEPMSDAKFQQFLKEIDTDGSGTINFKEFSVAMRGFVEKRAQIDDGNSINSPERSVRFQAHERDPEMARLSSSGDVEEAESKIVNEMMHEEDEDEDEEEMPEDIASLPEHQRNRRILLRAGWMMGIGTLVVLLFSDPMVDVLNQVGTQLNIPPFYIAFVLAPVASNASELIASIAYAKKKSKKTITISLGALLGAACMNNTFCLFIFLCLVFAKNLAWEFSAEVISILFIELCLFFISLMKTEKLYHAIIILSLYPLSIVIVWFLEKVVGLN